MLVVFLVRLMGYFLVWFAVPMRVAHFPAAYITKVLKILEAPLLLDCVVFGPDRVAFFGGVCGYPTYVIVWSSSSDVGPKWRNCSTWLRNHSAAGTGNRLLPVSTCPPIEYTSLPRSRTPPRHSPYL